MAIFYKLQYRKSKIHPNATGYFAMVCNKGTVSTNEVAEEIERNCSMKRSDVIAVLAELKEVIKSCIQHSQSVKLDGIGIFRPGISSSMADSPENFNPMKDIRGLRLNFLPEQAMQGGKRIKTVFANVHVVQEGGRLKPSKPEGDVSNKSEKLTGGDENKESHE